MIEPCECSDPGCPTHPGHDCDRIEECSTLYRIDMEDETGTLMCSDCADDAFQSGLFYAEDDA